MFVRKKKIENLFCHKFFFQIAKKKKSEYISDDLKTDIFCKFFYFIFNIRKFIVPIFLRVWGPTGAAPLDITCFWIEDPSQNKLRHFRNKPYQM